MATVAYDIPAELFISKSKGASRRPMTYRRFSTAAEAIKFAVEELSPSLLAGTILQIGEERFDQSGIRRLYDGVGYPLERMTDLARTPT
jgi:hypothetical protein